MSSYKEIVTKAVVGKAKKTISQTFTLGPDEMPNTVLGCWVINHSFSGTRDSGNKVLINGAFDVNVWYSFDHDKKTAVANKRFNYTDSLNVSIKNEGDLGDEIIVRCLHQPTVSNVKIENGEVKLDIEKEMGVEIIGDAKVKISVEDDYDEYDEVDDDIDEIVNNVDENYLK